MEKFWSFAKWILIGLAIFCLIEFCFSIFSNSSLISTIASWFNSDPIIVDAFKDAPTNYIGFTKEEIDNQTSEEGCPSKGDIECKIYMQDYLDVVVFYKEIDQKDGTKFYPNILFLKTDKGLVFDGCLNLRAETWNWFGTETYFEWKPEFDKKPYYNRNNAILLSAGDVGVYSRDFNFIDVKGFIRNPNIESVLNRAQQYIIKNLYPHFLSFYEENIKIYQGKDTSSGDFNAFYDFLYRSAILTQETQCFVDVTDLTFYPIPESDKELYPRTPTVEDDSTTYLFFDCNVHMQVFKESYDVSVIPSGCDKNIDANVEEKEVEEIKITPSYMSVVTLKLWTEEYDKQLFLATLEHMEALQKTPITFKFYLGGELRKQVVFDGTFAPSAGKTFAITKGNYIWEIESSGFIFSSYTGTQTITKNGTITHNFTYMDGAVQTSFRLHPASAECSELMLEQFPATVTVEGPKNFQFSFNELETVSMILDQGTYTYSITSEYLSFSPQTGTFEVTSENHDFKFIYFCEGASNISMSATKSETQPTSVKLILNGNVCAKETLANVYAYVFKANGTMEEIVLSAENCVTNELLGVTFTLDSLTYPAFFEKGSSFQFKIVLGGEYYPEPVEKWTNILNIETYATEISLATY